MSQKDGRRNKGFYSRKIGCYSGSYKKEVNIFENLMFPAH